MLRIVATICYLLSVTALAQRGGDYTTPVPILKQINRHNDDGSYSYGYEGADGSFKIETKYSNGEVYGKYGYVDDQGQVREVEYGASRRGFEPQGSDINVPPPTLKNNNPYPLAPNEQDDGQYREDPAVYFKDQQKYSRPVPASNFRLNSLEPERPRYNPPPPPPERPQYYNNPAPVYRPTAAPVYRPTTAPVYRPTPAPQQSYYSQPQPNYYQAPAPRNYVDVPTYHHPAVKNIDIWSGSYSIDYTGRRR